MKRVLVLVIAMAALGCSGGSKQDQMSDEQIQAAQKRVKSLEESSKAPK